MIQSLTHICRGLGVSLALLAMAVLPARGEDAPAKRTVVAGPSYAKGSFHRFFFGTDYRPLWTTPATFEVLDLGKEAGGLSPVRRVGGQQTKGLALKGKDGKNYTFRGLEKDASHLLDADLQGTLIAELLQDQMAAQHPASEVIARHILDAVAIPCPSWRLVVLPDDPALGDFRKDFAGAIGAFAEYPSAVSATNPGFRGVSEIVDHAELYKRLEAGQDVADVRALLKARLVDIFMGDWDRHRKQWRWGKFPSGPLFEPIPEDRDQAFARYEGYVLGRGRGRDPRFQNLKGEYGGIGGLTYNGWEQDRRLLAGLIEGRFHRDRSRARESAQRFRDRRGRPRHAAGVVQDRRRASHRRPQGPSRRTPRDCRQVLRAPGRPGRRLHDGPTGDRDAHDGRRMAIST